MALALPPGGRLVTCDVSEASMAVARATWAEAGVAAAVRGVVGPALATLDGLLASGEAGAWDFAYSAFAPCGRGVGR